MGDEICKREAADQLRRASASTQLDITHLVGRVGDADVEVREVHLDKVAHGDVELALLRPAELVVSEVRGHKSE